MPLHKNLKKTLNKVVSDSTKLGTELTLLKQAVDTVGNDVKIAREAISTSKTEFSEISSTKIGKDVLDLEIKNSQAKLQARLDEIINRIEVKLLSINKRINELKKQATALSEKQAFMQKTFSAGKPVIQPKTETRIKSKPAPVSKKTVPVIKESATVQKTPPPLHHRRRPYRQYRNRALLLNRTLRSKQTAEA